MKQAEENLRLTLGANQDPYVEALDIEAAGRRAANSPPACASAPVDADTTIIVADRDPPRLVPSSRIAILMQEGPTRVHYPRTRLCAFNSCN